MDIKQKIVDLCDDMIIFWQILKKTIESTPNEDSPSIVCCWQDHFLENSSTIEKLIDTKMNIEKVKDQLLMRQELRYDD